MTPYVPEPEVTWGDIKKAINTAMLPVVPAPLVAEAPIGPGSRVRVKHDVKNEDEFDFVEDYAGLSGRIDHPGCEETRGGSWCVRLDGHTFSMNFHGYELEAAA